MDRILINMIDVDDFNDYEDDDYDFDSVFESDDFMYEEEEEDEEDLDDY